MKIILLIMFILLPLGGKSYYVKLENYSNYTKYVMVKYKSNKGKFVTKEMKIRPKRHYGFFVYDNIFYLGAISYHTNGKVRYDVRGKDGVGFMKEIGGGRPIYYQKIDCEMHLRGVFKTVHLGI